MVKEEQQQPNEDKAAGLRSSMLSAFSWFQTKCSNIKLKRKREGDQGIYSPGSLLKGQPRLALFLIKDHCSTYNNFLYKTSSFQVLVTSFFPFPFGHKIINCSTIPSPSFIALSPVVHLHLAQSFVNCPFCTYYLSFFECAITFWKGHDWFKVNAHSTHIHWLPMYY